MAFRIIHRQPCSVVCCLLMLLLPGLFAACGASSNQTIFVWLGGFRLSTGHHPELWADAHLHQTANPCHLNLAKHNRYFACSGPGRSDCWHLL